LATLIRICCGNDYALGLIEYKEYYLNSLLSKRITRNEDEIEYTYDIHGRVIEENDISYVYDCFN